MFKILITLLVLAVGQSAIRAVSLGRVSNATVTERTIVPVLKFETDKHTDGSFRFQYEGGDKSFRHEEGHVENPGTDEEALEVKGSYRYIDADGQEIEVHYTAGKNGFVPVGTNIPREITELAKAAADLPNTTFEEEQYLKLKQRRARSQTEQKKEEAENLPKAADSQIVQVKVLVEEKPAKVEKQEKSEKVEQIEKVEKSDKVGTKSA